MAKRSKYEIVNFGTLMFEMAKDIGLVSNRDEIRKLPVDTQINLQKKASSAIGRMDDVIVDTHMSIKSKNGYLPGLPEWVLRELKIASYFLIEADPVLIKRRREMDPHARGMTTPWRRYGRTRKSTGTSQWPIPYTQERQLTS